MVLAALLGLCTCWAISPRSSNVPYKSELSHAPRLLVKEVRSYVGIASAAYCDTHNSTIKGFQLKAIIHGSDTRARVFFAAKGSQVVVSFSSTQKFWHFKTLYVKKKFRVPGRPRISELVSVSATSIQDPLIKSVANLLKNNSQLVLVGHSLGGAIATVMGPTLSEKFKLQPRNVRIITYNQPRVGNYAFAKAYNELNFNLTRVVNRNDHVANFPKLGRGWSHVHQEIYIDDGNYYLCRKSSSEDRACNSPKFNTLAYLHRHRHVADLVIKASISVCGFK